MMNTTTHFQALHKRTFEDKYSTARSFTVTRLPKLTALNLAFDEENQPEVVKIELFEIVLVSEYNSTAYIFY